MKHTRRASWTGPQPPSFGCAACFWAAWREFSAAHRTHRSATPVHFLVDPPSLDIDDLWTDICMMRCIGVQERISAGSSGGDIGSGSVPGRSISAAMAPRAAAALLSAALLVLASFSTGSADAVSAAFSPVGSLALSQSIWDHQFGGPKFFFALKLTDLYCEPTDST